MLLIMSACGAPPQTKSQVSVVYRASWRAQSGTTVVFPWPADGIELSIIQAMSVSDGGVAKIVDTPFEGVGLSVEGTGSVTATYNASKLEALSSGEGIPAAKLTRQVPDGGVADRIFKVNAAGGSSTVGVDFEYTVSRDCGRGCGGKRSWTYAGPVGLSAQPVATTFSEEKTP